jgi:hypothetical protein
MMEILGNYGFIPNPKISTHLNARHASEIDSKVILMGHEIVKLL